MKRSKKMITGIVSLMLLAALPANTLAAGVTAPAGEETIPAEATVKRSHYGSFSGTVKEIRNFAHTDNTEDPVMKYVLTEDENGSVANLFITADSYFVTDNELKEGVEVIGFYDANAPMLMIYPPQYTVAVIAVSLPEDQSIKTDFFDADLVSADGELKLNLSDQVKIQLPNGQAFDGELKNKTLVVLYSITTRSIPAQTTPSTIIVLPDALPADTPNEMLPQEEPVKNDSLFMVNGKSVDALPPYANHNNVMMVPVRGIAEALGYDVTWNGATKTILLGRDISLTIGQDSYANMHTTSIQLGTAPTLVEGRAYVPLAFFREVVGMNNAYMLEGQIVINNDEKME